MTCHQVAAAEVQSSDSLRMAAATCNSLPLAEVAAVIPRGEDPERIADYLVFEAEQRQAICFVGEVGNSSCYSGWKW